MTSPQSQLRPIRLSIRGMHCAGCVARVERALQSVPGVENAQVNLVTQNAVVRMGDSNTLPEQLIQAVVAAGYQATILEDDEQSSSRSTIPWQNQAREQGVRARQVIVGTVGLLLVLAVMLVPGLAQALTPWPAIIAATVVQVYLGMGYLLSAGRQLRRGGASMDTLIAIGTWTAYGAAIAETLGWLPTMHADTHGSHPGLPMYFSDAAMILTFITLGKYLESRSRFRASMAIRQLMDLSPQMALVIRGDHVMEVPVSDVKPGEIFRVRPGEKVPLDGLIVEGQSNLDQSWLTGESLPVTKQAGDEVFAGTINTSGTILVRATRPAKASILSQVVRLVEQAQESKPRLARLADRVVTWFVPTILAIAVLTFLIWGPLMSHWRLALNTLIAVLVVACPCALGLATPTAVLVASGRAASRGILVKNTQAFEVAAAVNVVVFDKTGTLTLGQPQLVVIEPAAGVDEIQLLRAAGTAEQTSLHPLARAVLAEVQRRQIALAQVDSVEILPGLGIRVQCQGRTIVLQTAENTGYQSRQDTPALARPTTQGDSGELQHENREKEQLDATIRVAVVEDGRCLGTLGFADRLSERSRDVVDILRRKGLHVILLTGDRAENASRVAAQVGIDEFFSDVTPSEKFEFIQRLHAEGNIVAMVGDGINDAAALAEADLGIAISAGADIAKESADIVLIHRDLQAVVDVLDLGRATVRVIKRNLIWAFAYNLGFIPLAAGVFYPWTGFLIPPPAAAAAMAASSVSVVLSSLMLAKEGRRSTERQSR